MKCRKRILQYKKKTYRRFLLYTQRNINWKQKLNIAFDYLDENDFIRWSFASVMCTPENKTTAFSFLVYQIFFFGIQIQFLPNVLDKIQLIVVSSHNQKSSNCKNSVSRTIPPFQRLQQQLWRLFSSLWGSYCSTVAVRHTWCSPAKFVYSVWFRTIETLHKRAQINISR